jgi:hypothetical protein
MRIQNMKRYLLLGALIASTISCGDVVRDGRSPVFLVIDTLGAAKGNDPTNFFAFLFSDVITNVTTPEPCSASSPCPTYFADSGRVQLRLVLKDLGSPTVPSVVSTNNEVTITRYHVNYRRSDGRNTQGVDVPYAFDGAATGTVPASGNITLGFELVRHVAKKEAPLIQLLNSAQVITTIADITFYGQDRVGNEISVTGSMQIDFGNFGD